MTARLLTLCQRSLGKQDGIRDYTIRLVTALNATGRIQTELLWRLDDGSWQRGGEAVVGRDSATKSGSLLSKLRDRDAILVQYNPFLYGRWGFAPWLPFVLLRLRFSKRRPRIALMVHEPFVPMVNFRWTLMGIWQRLQLRALRFSADVVFASIEVWRASLGAAWPRRPTYHLPVGSNLPDGRRFRDRQRQHIGADGSAIVVAAFGQNHPGRLWQYIVEASNSLIESGSKVILLNLGSDAPQLVGLDPRIVLHAPGDLSPDDVATWLSAADIYLAPFVDGASTRRTTLMSAMQHGLPIAATDGPLTDPILRSSGTVRLIPVNRRVEFVHAVHKLLDSPDECRALGDRARELYTKSFDWPVTAARLLTALSTPVPKASSRIRPVEQKMCGTAPSKLI
jgi:glycosyltransferase involved in cell wall biosynthesis